MYTSFGLENSSSSSSSRRSSFITQWQLRLPVSRSFVLHCKVRCANSLNLMQIWGCEIRVWLNTSKQHPQMFAFLIPLGVSLHYEPVGNLQGSFSPDQIPFWILAHWRQCASYAVIKSGVIKVDGHSGFAVPWAESSTWANREFSLLTMLLGSSSSPADIIALSNSCKKTFNWLQYHK